MLEAWMGEVTFIIVGGPYGSDSPLRIKGKCSGGERVLQWALLLWSSAPTGLAQAHPGTKRTLIG